MGVQISVICSGAVSGHQERVGGCYKRFLNTTNFSDNVPYVTRHVNYLSARQILYNLLLQICVFFADRPVKFIIDGQILLFIHEEILQRSSE